jgi:hypothetical protein
MSTIADVVKLRTGYANFVELKSAFDESKENADRMAMYRPTKAHRRAFERLCRGLYQPNDKKFYLLSGSYGTGKSHLCLMYANFLSRASGDPEIKGFYGNYEKLDAETAKMLRNVRKSGQYLVAICDYHAGRRFEDVVLKAVFDACKVMGLDAGVQTEFDEAERKLADWESKKGKKGSRDFYTDFSKALDTVEPGLSVDQLRASLKEFNSSAMVSFRSAYRECVGGQEFEAQSGNVIPILKSLTKSKTFKDRFKGLAIFFDEFGFTLEKHNYSTDILQGFMETICKNQPDVVFVGCIHKSFRAYADRFSQADAAVMEARLTEVDLANEGIEEIIGAIVETDKDSALWKKEIAPKTGVFDSLVPFCKTLKLFPWIDDVNRIRQRVLEDIYGVHPMSLACLLRLSSEIGSDARSTFTFFSGDVGGAEGSYAEFIKTAPLTGSGGKLSLYRVDQLFDFFQKELSGRNPDLRDQPRQVVNGYFASLDALRKSIQGELFDEQADDRVALLRTILIYQLCQIPTNVENIQFGMYCVGNSEEKAVESRLKQLAKSGALFYRQQSNTYELAVGSGEDPYALIDRYLKDSSLHPKDMVATFIEEAGDSQDVEFLDARQHNLHFSEDKRCKRLFVPAKDLGKKLWEEINDEWQANLPKEKKSYEGTVVYALCEDDADVQLARTTVKDIAYENIVMAVPHAPQPFADLLLRVKACRYFLPPSSAEKISAQTEMRLRDIFEDAEDGYLTQLQKRLRDILDGEAACWYGKGGAVIFDRPQQSHKPADIMCDGLFKRRCLIKHADLNLSHDDKWRTGKNTALRQAVDDLLSTEQVMIDNGNPENHGQKRYVEKVLFKGAGALRPAGSDGKVGYFECENDPDKLSDDFPVLKELCRQMCSLPANGTLSVGAFMEKVKAPPFGAGGAPITLSLAHVLRAFGERVRLYADSTKTSEIQVSSFDDLIEIASDPSTKTVIQVRDISAGQNRLVEGIAQAVHAAPLKHGEKRTVSMTHEAVSGWWAKIPTLAKVAALYEKSNQKRIKRLVEAFSALGHEDRFEFVLEKLPSAYFGEPITEDLTEKDAQKIIDEFDADIKLIETGLQLARTAVAESVSNVFGAKGDLVACESSLNAWFTGLNPGQRNPMKEEYDEETSQVLAVLGDGKTHFEMKLMSSLPNALGFGAVSDWAVMHIDEFASKLKQAKQAIDKAKADIPKVDIGDAVHKIHQNDKVTITLPKGVAGIVYTINGDDPKKSDQIKQVADKANLAEELKDLPNVVIKLRPVDAEGNFGEMQTVQIVNKDKEYEVTVENNDIFGGAEGRFRFPEDDYSLVLVLRSLIEQAQKRKLIDAKKAQKVKEAISELSSRTGYQAK